MVRVCFVCLGNICRSPTAEGIMRKLVHEAGLGNAIDVDSAGTGGWHVGKPADERSRETALNRGVTLESRARSFLMADYARCDFILAVDAENLRALRDAAPDDVTRRKVRLLRDFDPDAPDGAEVPDPYYGVDGFDRVFDMCEAACRGLLMHLTASDSGPA